MIKVAIALGLAILFGALGDILLSIGMRANGEVKINKANEIPGLMRLVFSRPVVVLGILSMALYFCAYIAALAWVDVSVANPMTALSYLIASIYAASFLRERVSLARGAGIFLIILGAIFVGISS